MPAQHALAASEAATAAALADAVRGADRSKARRAGAAGFVLADLNFKVVYANQGGAEILSYPQQPRTPADWTAVVQQRLRTIFQGNRLATEGAAVRFRSGRRRYVCQPTLLESSGRPPMVALVLERLCRDPLEVEDLGRRYHLSPRESETVLHLVQGLTTKKIAERMSVSPNTVKQFVRLTMTKMGVTTRSGIVGKLLTGEAARGSFSSKG